MLISGHLLKSLLMKPSQVGHFEVEGTFYEFSRKQLNPHLGLTLSQHHHNSRGSCFLLYFFFSFFCACHKIFLVLLLIGVEKLIRLF